MSTFGEIKSEEKNGEKFDNCDTIEILDFLFDEENESDSESHDRFHVMSDAEEYESSYKYDDTIRRYCSNDVPSCSTCSLSSSPVVVLNKIRESGPTTTHAFSLLLKQQRHQFSKSKSFINKVTAFECKICVQLFRTRYLVYLHIQKVHSQFHSINDESWEKMEESNANTKHRRSVGSNSLIDNSLNVSDILETDEELSNNSKTLTCKDSLSLGNLLYSDPKAVIENLLTSLPVDANSNTVPCKLKPNIQFIEPSRKTGKCLTKLHATIPCTVDSNHEANLCSVESLKPPHEYIHSVEPSHETEMHSVEPSNTTEAHSRDSLRVHETEPHSTDSVNVTGTNVKPAHQLEQCIETPPEVAVNTLNIKTEKSASDHFQNLFRLADMTSHEQYESDIDEMDDIPSNDSNIGETRDTDLAKSQIMDASGSCEMDSIESRDSGVVKSRDVDITKSHDKDATKLHALHIAQSCDKDDLNVAKSRNVEIKLHHNNDAEIMLSGNTEFTESHSLVMTESSKTDYIDYQTENADTELRTNMKNRSNVKNTFTGTKFNHDLTILQNNAKIRTDTRIEKSEQNYYTHEPHSPLLKTFGKSATASKNSIPVSYSTIRSLLNTAPLSTFAVHSTFAPQSTAALQSTSTPCKMKSLLSQSTIASINSMTEKATSDTNKSAQHPDPESHSPLLKSFGKSASSLNQSTAPLSTFVVHSTFAPQSTAAPQSTSTPCKMKSLLSQSTIASINSMTEKATSHTNKCAQHPDSANTYVSNESTTVHDTNNSKAIKIVEITDFAKEKFIYMCTVCRFSCATLADINAHSHQHAHKTNHQCTKCRRCFLSFTELAFHKCDMTTSDEKADEHTVSCVGCNTKFNSWSAFEGHFVCSHVILPRKFHCQICSSQVLNKSIFHNHIKEKHTELYCGVCNKSFLNLDLSIAHKMTHTKKKYKKYTCTVCSKVYKFEKVLVKHIKSHLNAPKTKKNIHVKVFKAKNVLQKAIDSEDNILSLVSSINNNVLSKEANTGVTVHTKEANKGGSVRSPKSGTGGHPFLEESNDCDVYLTEENTSSATLPEDSNARSNAISDESKAEVNTSTNIHSKMSNTEGNSYTKDSNNEGNYDSNEPNTSGNSHTKKSNSERSDGSKGSNTGANANLKELIKRTIVFACRCTSCGKTFAAKSSLKQHAFSHCSRLPFACGKCEKGFWLSGARHKCLKKWNMAQKKMLNLDFICEICDVRVDTREKFIKHFIVTHVSYKKVQCPLCSQFYSDKATLNSHVLHMHSENPLPFKCSICDKRCNSKSSLKAHSRIHFAPTISCDICSNMFKAKAALNKHIRRCHSDKAVECPICHKLLKNELYLYNHKARVHSTAQYMCTFCSKIYKTLFALKKHTESAHEDKRYTCSKCDKSFSSSMACKLHEKHQHSERRYQCSLCAQLFVHKHHLTNHMLKHTGERTFKCKLCPKSFGRKQILDTHMLSHTGVMDYSCDVCPKEFRRKTDLNKHKRLCHSAENLINTQT